VADSQGTAYYYDMPSWEVGMVRRRIGILTGGGDVPGLNAVIKSVTYRGSENDIEVVGLRPWLGGPHAPEPRGPDQQVPPHYPAES